jgi:uncharacterized protein involved in type VI secretion and phage assembly
MTSGYGGSYKGVVVDTADPMAQNRATVTVPDIGIQAEWASACRTSPGEAAPGVGEEVTVVCEGGDSDKPVWLKAAADGSASVNGNGIHQGTVIDRLDPQALNRLRVTVPDVTGSEPQWATPSSSVATPPDVGSPVWVQFQNGDASYPVWVGVP